jgi:protein-S-isoprenylcysteine O-methyltransferase Ste14
MQTPGQTLSGLAELTLKAGSAMLWKQIQSFARPVVVLGVIPFGITWLLSISWHAASIQHFGWLAKLDMHAGFGTGLTHTITRNAGWVLLAVGLVFFWWAEGTFIWHGLTLAPEDQPTRLVTSGPYRYCTHPMFFGVLCVSYAEGFLLNAWVFAFTVVFQLWLLAWYLPYEEEPTLRRYFGDRWTEYASTTFHGVLPIGLVNPRYRYPRRPLGVQGAM